MSLETLRRFALDLPHTEEGTSCNNVVFKAGAKNFFFMGVKDDVMVLRFKLVDKVGEAEQLAEKSPDVYSVGTSGWTTVCLPLAARFPGKRFQAWMKDSYRALVPRKLQQYG